MLEAQGACRIGKTRAQKITPFTVPLNSSLKDSAKTEVLRKEKSFSLRSLRALREIKKPVGSGRL